MWSLGFSYGEPGSTDYRGALALVGLGCIVAGALALPVAAIINADIWASGLVAVLLGALVVTLILAWRRRKRAD
ncbi:MAG: hypothetical protein ACXVGN_03135 [Mycobacteriaceae bacterium]